jgi:hypothetical protein
MAQPSQPLTVYVTKSAKAEQNNLNPNSNEQYVDQIGAVAAPSSSDHYRNQRLRQNNDQNKNNEVQLATDFPFLDSPASLSSFNGNPISPFSIASQVSPHMSEDDESYAADINTHSGIRTQLPGTMSPGVVQAVQKKRKKKLELILNRFLH